MALNKLKSFFSKGRGQKSEHGTVWREDHLQEVLHLLPASIVTLITDYGMSGAARPCATLNLWL